ncbi:MAG: hypothetical protein KDE53_14945, partial [Caldilineaceae bacterium]|nr:hypothetical protein [Caldilineaceae bacterium]
WVAVLLATAQQQYTQAAMHFGLAEQVRRRIHYPGNGVMQPAVDAALATVQAALEPAAFAKAFAAGREMALEQAFATILVASSKAAM